MTAGIDIIIGPGGQQFTPNQAIAWLELNNVRDPQAALTSQTAVMPRVVHIAPSPLLDIRRRQTRVSYDHADARDWGRGSQL